MKVQSPQKPPVSEQTLARLPGYLLILRRLLQEGNREASAAQVARELLVSPVLVRKDLAAVSRVGGKPKTGFDLAQLIGDIEHYLGADTRREVILVGAGSLGCALMSFSGFRDLGFRIVAAFDSDPALTGLTLWDVPILSMEQLPAFCRGLEIRLAILTVPARAAPSAAGLLIASGIRAIWNFAPVHLDKPADVLIKNENLAASLALLAGRLGHHIPAGRPEKEGKA